MTVSSGWIVPPASSASRLATRWAAYRGSSGSTSRSKRRDASDESLCRRDERAITIGSKCAASITTSVVDSEISVDAPPITPATPIGPESSVISRSSTSSSRVWSSSVISFSPADARRTTMSPLSRSLSYPWIGWPSSSIT